MRLLALILTILTGFTGLVYEVSWQKGLATLLGSHSEATAAVLAIFLGGLSLGYSLFGRVSSRITRSAAPGRAGRRLLLTYGLVEAGIGAFALIWPNLFELARAASASFPLDSSLSFGLDVLLTALLIGPPAVLMGGTVPLLTQALARDLGDATRFHAFVYGFNTLGAFAGALAGGFFLIPWLGIPGCLRAMGLINLAVGASFCALCNFARGASATADADEVRAQPAALPVFAAAALLLGFAMMALQTVLIRVGGLALGASHFAFAIGVATFVLCIALGSLAVSAFGRIPTWVPAACPIAMGLALALLYPLIQYAPYAAHVLRSLFQSIDQAFYPYYFAAAFGVLGLFAIPLGLSGASLPLIFHALRDEVGELGGLAGRIYGWNTLGSLLGALLGGYVLLHWLDLHHIYRIAVAATLVAGGLLAVRTAGAPRVPSLALVIVAIAALALFPRWDPRQIAAGLFRQRDATPATWRGPEAVRAENDRNISTPEIPVRLLFYDDDPISTVSVIEYAVNRHRTLAITNNGKSDGSLIGDYATMAMASLLPCMIAERCQQGFVIGLGTGVSTGELAALDEIQRVVVAEISPGVIEGLPLFDYGNRRASKNPKVEIVRSDAYRALLHSDARWDVIVSEPSNPWVAGVEMLYSREFLSAARDRLAPGGVYAQWIHTYEIDDATLELVLRTYASVFGRVSVWYTLAWDLLLIGVADDSPGPQLDRIAQRFEHPDIAAGLRRAGIGTLEELLAHELIPVGLVTREALPGEVHTLLYPHLSDRAARAFFRGGNGSLPYLPAAGAQVQVPLLQQRQQQQPFDEETRKRVVLHVCASRPHECATLLARWHHDAPDSEPLRKLLEQVRKTNRAEHITPEKLDRLASLFGGGPGRLQVDAANALTELYIRYFFHGEPFRPEAVRAVWRSCAEPECARARQTAERRLDGPDGAG